MRIVKINSTFWGYCLLIGLWLAAYKSADLFGFFKTYSSLWFLPAGVTLAICLAVPKRFLLAPLLANLLLALPSVCLILGVEFTNYRDPILHSLRLYAIYGGLGLLLRYGIGIVLPARGLKDVLWQLGLTLLASGIGALSGVSLHAAVGNFPWSVAWEIIRPWAVGDAIGAIIVPPLLVPLLLQLFESENPNSIHRWDWPSANSLAVQVIVVIGAMAIGFLSPKYYPQIGEFWYAILLPPIFFAISGGVAHAATSVFITTMLSPPAAYFLSQADDRQTLQFLLLISSLVGLAIGAAITDRKRAFEIVKQSELFLEQQVADRTEELEKTHGFLRHLIRSIGHDLKQPVQSINIMLDGLSREMKEQPEALRLEDARSIGQTASEFIEKVLEFARRDAGNFDVEIKEVKIEKVFQLLSATYQPIADLKGVVLQFEAATPIALSDETLLFEAISNLVDNSIRLSGKGNVVGVTAFEEHDAIKVSVTDEFSQSPISRRAQSGFGLEIVTQICELLGANFEREPNVASISIPSKNLKVLS